MRGTWQVVAVLVLAVVFVVSGWETFAGGPGLGRPGPAGSPGGTVHGLTPLQGAALTATPSSGPVGTSVTFSGSGYAVLSTVTVSWYPLQEQTQETACAVATSSGSFSCAVTIPPTPGGSYTFTATDPIGNTASTSFTVTTLLSDSPTEGEPLAPPGAVTFTGTGYGASSLFDVSWLQGSTTETVCGGSTNPAGTFSCRAWDSASSPMPWTEGTYTFTGVDSDHNSATVTYQVIPSLWVWPASASAGTVVTFGGFGYRPGYVVLTWTHGTVCAVYRYGGGNFSCEFRVPAVSAGPYVFTGGLTGPDSASTTFTVIPPWTYSVNFTETGLPTGTPWSVEFDNLPSTLSSTGRWIMFFGVANGVQTFTINSPPSYSAGSFAPDPATSSAPCQVEILVSGANVTETFTFAFVLYPSPSGLPVGTSPQGVVFDPTGVASADTTVPDGAIYVANEGSASLTILDATNGNDVLGAGSSLSLSDFDGSHTLSPVALAVDSSDNVWVAGMSSASAPGAGVAGVVEVTGSSMDTASSFTVSGMDSVTGIAVTPNGGVYVEGSESGSTVVAYCSALPCASPYVVTFDPGAPGDLAVDASANVWAVQTSTTISAGVLWTNLLATPTPIYLTALSVAANVTYVNGLFYVGGLCSGIPIGSSLCAPGDAGIDVVNPAQSPSEVALVDTGYQVTAGWGIAGISYDPWVGCVDAAYNTLGATPASGLLVVSETDYSVVGRISLNGALAGGVTATASPVPENVFVATDPPATGSLVLISHDYQVAFSESGLSPGQTFQVTLSSTTQSLTTNGDTDALTFLEADNSVTGTTTYAYTIAAVPGWITPGGLSGTVTVNGANQTVSRAFAQVTYTVTFTESGLPAATEWYVNITGTVGLSLNGSGTMLTAYLPNGSYTYVVSTTDKQYAAPGGWFPVTSPVLPISEAVTFVLQLYTVTLTETGIPAKTLAKDGWMAVLNGVAERSRTSTIVFTPVLYGLYPLLVFGPSGYTTDVYPRWWITGTSEIPVAFTKGRTLTLTFTEKGIPPGREWCAGIQPRDQSGTPPWVLTFYDLCTSSTSERFQNLTPEDYMYTVAKPAHNVTLTLGKTAEPVMGELDFTKNSKLTITYRYTYGVTFTEEGLPSGSWSVKIRGVTETNASGEPICFTLGNGTYSYKVGKEAGYQIAGSPTSPIVVNGKAVPVNVTFSVKGPHTPRTGVSPICMAGPVPMLVGLGLARRRRT